ncbi:pyocin knob domain-containing protein [Chromobacterium violaceum]|uniref:pyocin knob domain-containing protein n=1 Tax=Chromobacterium violaceum TaxID=536 RepID=UPI0009DABB6E|nr:hypothetical protein [Chromobacterium violaceum]OQS30393.1 hypothetical protein B0T41_00090 [Chromobacterium violaceum]
MTALPNPQKPGWPSITQYEVTERLLGGPGGPLNRAPSELLERTEFLKKQIDDIVSGALAAEYADRLKTPRNIAMTGDGSWNVTFDGNGNVSGALTLANSGVTAGSYGMVTVDTKGRVTAGRQMQAVDLPALDWSKISSGKPTTLAGYGITDAQPLSADLTALSDLKGSVGLYVNTGPGTCAARSLAAGQGVTVSNGDGKNGNPTVALANSGAAAGSYGIVTVDTMGRVTAGRQMQAADVPALDWSKITSGKPTTLAGYGIQDGQVVGALPDGADLDKAVVSGCHYISNPKNAPAGVSYGVLSVMRGAGDTVIQFVAGITGRVWFRNGNPQASGGGGKFQNWESLATITDIENIKSGPDAVAYANSLKTPRNISMTGDGSWSVAFDGSGNASGALRLANSGVSVGSYGMVTVDAKGRVTAGRQMQAADVPALDWSKITSGKPTTLDGYGIADAIPQSAMPGSVGSENIWQRLPNGSIFCAGRVNIPAGGTVTVPLPVAMRTGFAAILAVPMSTSTNAGAYPFGGAEPIDMSNIKIKNHYSYSSLVFAYLVWGA